MSERQFPGWLGPIIGIPVGVGLGYRVWAKTKNGSLHFCLAAGVALGVMGGCLIWFSDWMAIKNAHKQLENKKFKKLPVPSTNPLWPILAWCCCILPFAGLLVAIVAYRKTQGANVVFYSLVPAGATTMYGFFLLMG